MAEPESESESEQQQQPAAKPKPETLTLFASFAYLLSPLILRALADLGFSRPTRVQQQAIPLALENRDVLARAPTGSGKTAAYCIPLLQKLLNAKNAVGTLHGGGGCGEGHQSRSPIFFFRILLP
jgi:superfamily II DNA/RNA helicase